MEPTLFGIGKAEWELYNSFANWLAALGTIAAVILSLHFARKSGKPQASVSVGHRIIVERGQKTDHYPEVIVFRIANTGDRTIRVTQLAWETGIFNFNNRFAIQTFDPAQSSPLPIELSHGQEASWLVPMDMRERHWIDYFVKGFLSTHPRTSIYSLRAVFHTSTGASFSVRPEKALRIKLLESAKKRPPVNTTNSPT